ncbi:MaoC family dehydratase N-terminal domain-containing protein [Nocardia sp. NPDC019395]|uniref:FAS1-like dehydratase domain-containing protein n=1 Tax=Nocardia sp. NPDC019395 TaxID=3154686 RepID=UPI00340C9C61
MQIVNGLPRPTRTVQRNGTAPRARNSAASPADRCRVRGTSPYIVTRERIRIFADLTHNEHPIHRHETAARDYGYPALVAPPTFATLAMLRAQDDAIRILAPGVRHSPLLHTRQTLDIRRLLVAGDIVTTDVQIRSVRTTSEYAMVEAHLVLTGHDGEIVQSGSSFLHVCIPTAAAALSAARLSAARETAAVPHAVPEVSVHRDPAPPGIPLPRRTFRLDRTELDSYAALGYPRSTPAARPNPGSGTGPPSGMMRLALTAGYLSSCLGDPAAVSRYEAEFTHFGGRPGRTVAPVEISGRVISVDRTGSAAVELDGRCLERRLFIHAQAVLRPPAH